MNGKGWTWYNQFGEIKIAAEVEVPVMIGADGVTAGQAGLVPAPAATDNKKYLRGDGTWVQDDTAIYLSLWN